MAVAIVGGGVMGETILAGLLRSGVAPADAVVVEKRAERAAEVAQRHGVRAVDEAAAVAGADLIVLAVKPQDMGATLAVLAPHVDARALVVSIAAGITTGFIEQRLPAGVAVARVMPNTPALVDQGMAAVSPGAHCTPDQVARAEGMMRAVGEVVTVPEQLQDAVTAVSGSGPAYVFLVVEAMIDAAVSLGLDRAVARDLVVQTVAGAAALLRHTGEDPATLRQQVTSPGGTTAAALAELEARAVRESFDAAMRAARDRSRELAGG